MQFDVDAQFQVVAGHRVHIVGSIVVAALDSSRGVTDKDLLALDTSQPRLITLLDAQVTGVVAGPVVTVVLDVLGIDFADVAQHVGPHVVVVLPEDALHDKEAGETVQFFLETSVIFGRKVVHEHLLGESRVVAVLQHLLPAQVELLTTDFQRVAEIDGVEWQHVLGNHHQVILGRVIHDKFVVAVIDQSARGIDDFLHEGIVVGIGLVGAVEHLQLHQPRDVDNHDDDDEAADDKLAFLEIIIFSHDVC